MKRSILILVLIASLGAYGQSEENQKVNQLHLRKFDWLINKNYDSLNWLIEPGAKYIHSNGWIQSKQEVIDDLKSGKLNYTSVNVSESSVALYNNHTAVVTGKGSFKGLMPDKSEFNIHLLYTEVYVKHKKQWKLVSRQACKLP
jgi:Domain of unknown function (DUF4440)